MCLTTSSYIDSILGLENMHKDSSKVLLRRPALTPRARLQGQVPCSDVPLGAAPAQGRDPPSGHTSLPSGPSAGALPDRVQEVQLRHVQAIHRPSTELRPPSTCQGPGSCVPGSRGAPGRKVCFQVAQVHYAAADAPCRSYAALDTFIGPTPGGQGPWAHLF